MRYKAAIFDLDGTILDSMAAWDDVGGKFLKNHEITPPNGLQEILKTLSFEESAEYFIEKLGVKLSTTEIISQINKMVEEKYNYSIKLKPFVKEYLEKLHKKNIKMCIATALNKTLAEQALKRLAILNYFDFILTCADVGSGKDKPDIYLKASQRLGHPSKDILVFEDALHCIESAKAAGFDVVSVYDKSSENQLAEIKGISDYHINSFNEMECLF